MTHFDVTTRYGVIRAGSMAEARMIAQNSARLTGRTCKVTRVQETVEEAPVNTGKTYNDQH